MFLINSEGPLYWRNLEVLRCISLRHAVCIHKINFTIFVELKLDRIADIIHQGKIFVTFITSTETSDRQ